MPKKQKFPRPVHVWRLIDANVNGRRLKAEVIDYGSRHHYMRGFQIYDHAKLVKEEGPIFNSGQGSGSYKIPTLWVVKNIRWLVEHKTNETALEQSLTSEHKMFWKWSASSRVFIREDGQVGYEITVSRNGPTEDDKPEATDWGLNYFPGPPR